MVFNGEQQIIKSRKDFNKLLSTVCDVVYNETPIIRNELFNKQKISSAISLARVNLLDAMIEHWQEEDFGFSQPNIRLSVLYTIHCLRVPESIAKTKMDCGS